MAEMPDVIGGETITEDWGNDIRDRTIQRYATAAERTTENPSPTAGDLSFREDAGVIEVYAAGAWKSPIPAASTSAAGQVQLSSSTSSTSETIAATSLAAKTAWDKGNHAHPYSGTGHDHDGDYAPPHGHPYASSGHGHTSLTMDSVVVNNATVGNLANTGWISTGDLRPDSLWPYNNANGSIRWMGTGAALGQSHTPSSVEHKKNVQPVDPAKAVFARLEPVWFQYKESHPQRDRYGDSWKTHENPPIGRMGFTYEQVKEVVPQWAYEADGMKAVSYEGMLPDFIAWAVATITDLSDRVSVLEAKLGEV